MAALHAKKLLQPSTAMLHHAHKYFLKQFDKCHKMMHRFVLAYKLSAI